MSKKIESSIRLRHDELLKKILENEKAARDFLKAYLPESVAKICDFTKISHVKESFIDSGLKNSASDVIFKVKTKDSSEVFVLTILEHQSKSDYWIALRLFEYTLSLLRNHIRSTRSKKLPIVASIVYYNGLAKYNAPLNFFDLFEHRELAKEMLNADYKLVDLQAISNDEIKESGHVPMLNFFMKNIWQKDMIRLWHEFFKRFVLNLSGEENRLYMTEFLCYTMVKLSEDKKPELTELIKENLSDKEEGAKFMRSIAQSWFDEGVAKGEATGIAKGKEEGILEGKEAGIVEGEAIGQAKAESRMVKLMLNNGMSKAEISRATGFNISRIDELLSINLDHK